MPRAWIPWTVCLALLLSCEPGGDGASADAADVTDALDAAAEDVGPDADADEDGETITPEVDPLFLGGCPEPGRALARRLTHPDARVLGHDAIGRTGDLLLANERAAFVIEDVGRADAYYIYGGILVDAVALDGCRQAGPDRFGELGLLMGTFTLNPFYMSTIRGFRGESMEVIHDGADGGAAVVRVRGVDDTFWLVELELTRQAFLSGEHRPRSEPYGVEVVVDYVLEPGAPVLRVDVTLVNVDDEPKELIPGGEVQFGDGTTQRAWARDELSLGGFGLAKGIPWIVASGGDGAWAFAMLDGELASAYISGVTALLDYRRTLADPIALAPAGEVGDAGSVSYLVSVGATDANSAVRPLAALDPEPVPGWPYQPVALSGVVVEADGEAPIPGALVELQARAADGDWRVLDDLRADEAGRFSGSVPDFWQDPLELRLLPRAAGRADVEPTPLELDHVEEITLSLGPAGRLEADVRDDAGASIPAKILLLRDGQRVGRYYAGAAPGGWDAPPGDYEVSVTRGYEYTTWQGEVSITADEPGRLAATLTHAVDTGGHLSYDGHAHAGPSSDSTVSIADRIRTVAGEGLDVIVSTDHEIIADWSPGIAEAGLEGWVATMIGCEVTATLPEHTNMYPVALRPDLDGRGGMIRWYGMTLGEIYAAERERGAAIRQLNHPRGSGWMRLIGYDRLTGLPTLEDPTALGFDADAELWSWDFEAFELMNDPEDIFLNPDKPDQTGLFDDWMSFLNLGHRVTAVGVSDIHGWESPGRPRTYIEVDSDDLDLFDEDAYVAAIVAGRAQIGAGAFLRVAANGGTVGDLVSAPDGLVSLNVSAQAIPEIDVRVVTIYANCDQVAVLVAPSPNGLVKLDESIEISLDADAHLVVAAFGRDPLPRGLRDYDPEGAPRAITNAIYVDVDGDGAFTPSGGKTCDYDANPGGL